MTRWYKRNDFESNQEYAEKVLDRFEITKYHFICENGKTSLLIEKNLKKYKVVLNDHKEQMEIYRCDVHNTLNGKYTKENMVLKKYFCDDCIWNCIKWISNDGI